MGLLLWYTWAHDLTPLEMVCAKVEESGDSV